MAIAPTDRSMPAVKMTSVWPIARAAITDSLLQDDADRGGLGETRIDDREGDE